MLHTTKDAGAALEPGPGEAMPAAGRSIDTGGAPLRSYAARGMLLNGAFDVGLALLGLARGIILAALLTRSAYGVWGILVVSLGVLARLKYVGISDKYIQQDEEDQELAFQKAFTLELLMTAAALIPMVAALPVIALIYGHWDLVAPGLVVLSALVADALQAPLWIYYRQMNFRRQRWLGGQIWERRYGLTHAHGHHGSSSMRQRWHVFVEQPSRLRLARCHQHRLQRGSLSERPHQR